MRERYRGKGAPLANLLALCGGVLQPSSFFLHFNVEGHCVLVAGPVCKKTSSHLTVVIFLLKSGVHYKESQHGQGWQGPLGITQPNPLLKQGHPEQAAQHRVQVGLEYLQRRRLHSRPGQPGPGLRHPQREEVLPHVRTELPLLQFVPIAPCPVTGHH